MPTMIRLLALLMIASGCATAQETDQAWVQELERRAEVVRATPRESRWMTIPWVNSAIEGERLARQTRRPILYWNVDDDPLDRC